MKNASATSATTFASLLAQLEESKFVRLFRYLIDNRPEVGAYGPDNLESPVQPLDLPDAELYVKLAGRVSSLRSIAATWCFQIAHLPSCFWHADHLDDFIAQRLRKAFENLRTLPDPLATLQGDFAIPEPHSRLYPIPERYDYYFLTNIPHDIREDSLERFSHTAHDLFDKILHIPHPPAFGLGTPETIATKSASEVQEFVVDLLNTPSSYYFVAREGKISIVPTTEHGTFLASMAPQSIDQSSPGLSTVITSAVSREQHLLSPGLSDLYDLINDSKTSEDDLQNFFATYPQFLFALDERYCEIRPHVCLLDAKGDRLVPDFMARIQDTNIWDVIELKLPKHAATVGRHGHDKVSASAAHAIAALLQYRDFFSKRTNRARLTKTFGTAPYEPCLVVVIGRGRSTQRYEWRTARAGFARVHVVSYDYLFERARQLKTSLSTLSLASNAT